MLVFSLLSIESDLKQWLVTLVGGELRNCLKDSDKYRHIVAKLEADETIWTKAVASANFLSMKLDANVVERLVIARILSPVDELRIYQQLVMCILGEEYLDKNVDITFVESMIPSPLILVNKS